MAEGHVVAAMVVALPGLCFTYAFPKGKVWEAIRTGESPPVQRAF